MHVLGGLFAIIVVLVVNCNCAIAFDASYEDVFRNVTRFPYVHMTMIEKIDTNTYLMFWQSSHVGEGSPDQRIVMSRSFDAGATWSVPVDVVTGDGVPVWGPSTIYTPQDGILFLYYALSVPENIRPPSDHHYPGGDIVFRTTADLGITWSEPTTLLTYNSATRGNVSKMTANKPVFLSRDQKSWALPFWQEPHPHNRNDTGPQCAGVLITVDGGKTHEARGCITPTDNCVWVIENSIAHLSQVPAVYSNTSSLSLRMMLRTKCGWLYQSHSSDSGFTWSSATASTVPNPDSKAYIASVLDEEWTPQWLLLACNPSDTLGRGLLSLLYANVTSETFNVAVILENNSAFAWDYPTIQVVEYDDRANFRVAVSYSAYSHTEARIAWVNQEAARPAALSGNALEVVLPALFLVMMVGFVVWKRRSTFRPDEEVPLYPER